MATAFSERHRIDGKGHRGRTEADLWGGAATANDAYDWSRLALFLRRSAIKSLLIAAIAAAVVLGSALLYFNKYVATALILFNPHMARITQSPGVLPGIGSDALAIESFVEIVNANDFLGKVVDKLHLTRDPEFDGPGPSAAIRRSRTVDNLKKKLSIDRRGSTYLVEVSVSTHDPNKSARLANEIAGMIVAEEADQRAHVTRKADAWLQGRLAGLRAQVRQTSDAAARLKAKLRITDAGKGDTVQEREVSELSQQSVLASVAASQALSKLNQLRQARKSGADKLPAALQSLTLAGLRQQYAVLTRQLAEETAVLGARHPQVLSLQAQIAEAQRQIHGEVDRLIGAAKADYAAALQHEKSIAGQLQAAQVASGDLAQKEVRLQALEREANADRSLYDQMLSRQKEIGEIQRLDVSDVRVAAEATAPTRPSRPSGVILAAASCLLGLTAGFGFSFLAESARPSFKTVSDAERETGLTVVGILPFAGEAPPRRDARYPRREIARWFSDICTVAVNGPEKTGRTILVTSSLRGEGKSTIAANLAACIARGGEMVLLIEASRSAAYESRTGLLDVLRRGEGLAQALIDRDDSGVSILPFGRRSTDDPAAISALMRGRKLEALMQECRRWFDVIVIDGPTALGAGYTSVLASISEIAILAVEWNATSPSLVREAADRLGATETVLVLNKVDLSRYGLFDPSFNERIKDSRADVSAD